MRKLVLKPRQGPSGAQAKCQNTDAEGGRMYSSPSSDVNSLETEQSRASAAMQETHRIESFRSGSCCSCISSHLLQERIHLQERRSCYIMFCTDRDFIFHLVLSTIVQNENLSVPGLAFACKYVEHGLWDPMWVAGE